jgi:hypothetical protein
MTKPGLSVLLVSSFILAIAAFVGSPWIFWDLTKDQHFTDEVRVWSMLIGPIWILFASISVWCYGRSALWVLLGLPFALASDAWYVGLMFACSTGHGCL